SIGALNGALFALGKIDTLLDLYENFDVDLYFKFGEKDIERFDLDDIKVTDLPQLTKMVYQLLKQGGVDITPLKSKLEEEVDENELRRSDINLGLVTLGIPKIRPLEVFVEEIPQGKVHEYLIASAYLPFFKADERRYIDGWFVDNVPLDLLLKKGPFEQIYVIRSHSGGLINSDWNREEVVLMTPSRPVGPSYNLNQKKMKENLLMGYYDMLRVLKGYEGKRFYFKDLPDLKKVLLNEEVLRQFKKRFSKLEDYDVQRYFYEELLPGLAKSLNLGVKSTYQEIFLELLEAGGYYLDIYPNRVYDIETYIEELREALSKKEVEWNLKEKVFSEVAKYTWGWFGDLQSLVLAFLDLMVSCQGR
ncbi:MAG TPA: patatin-like phospholipase family protein, partial [Clostridia bacterium]|nr:patatin-like phospholipase family protein [Clostridia bacterium]